MDVTFKPISGNRYRCNQTGVVVPHGKTKSYRRAMANNNRSKKTNKVYTYPGSVSSGSSIQCPNCHAYVWVRESGIVECPNEHKIRVQVKVRGYSWW